VLSRYVEPGYAVDLLAEGVGGLRYLLEERVREVDDLVRALQDVCRGGSVLDPTVVEALLVRVRMLRRARPARAGAVGPRVA
jgi:DNA-binding NarL/FixJ family response regulator